MSNEDDSPLFYGEKHVPDEKSGSVRGWEVPLRPMVEIRVTDPVTGGQKGSKMQRFSLIPADWLWAMAEHYGIGSKKYSANNWKLSYAWHLSCDAMERHYVAWKMGEDLDAETGSHHLIAAAWHLIALWWFQKHNKGTDDVRQ